MSIWNSQRRRLLDEGIAPVARDAVVESVRDGIIVVDLRNRVVDINPAASRIIGRRAIGAIGRPIARVLTDHANLIAHYYDKTETHVEITAGEHRAKRQFDVHFSPVYDDRGSFAGRLIVFRDITARVKAEAAFRAAEAETRKQLTERGRAEKALRELNQALEERIQERTAQLTRMNAELAHEVEERIQAEVELRERNRELLSLQAALAATVSSLDLPFVLETVTWEMINLLSVDDCTISEWDAETDTLAVLAEYNSTGETAGDAPTITYSLAHYPLKKKTLMERCAQQVTVSQADADTGEFADMQEANVKNLLLLPMVFQSRVVGLVELKNNWVERTLTDHEISLAQFLANQAAVAVENARLYAETQRRLREQTALREAGAAILSALEPKTVLSRIAEQMGQAIDSTSAYICDFDPESQQATVLAEYIGPTACAQEQPSDLGAVYAVADPKFLNAMLAGQHDTDYADDPGLAESDRAHMQQFGAKSILYIPLLVGSRLIGFVELWDSRQRQFAPDEISLCHGIAQQAAIALNNAQLYERAQGEIAERKRAETQIRASLKEKEVLLQEIHHRVKNNLQVVSSLLSLQSNYVEHDATLEMFKESQNRILSMALIHEKLYRSRDLSKIDLGEYIQTLSGELIRSYRARSGPVDLKVQTTGVFLSIEKAVPCGLIVNELVSNALKHAFPADADTAPYTRDGRAAEICIDLSSDAGAGVTLVVADNGIGFPDDLDFQNVDSLGIRLIHTLVSQLEGTLELRSDEGTEFRLAFAAS